MLCALGINCVIFSSTGEHGHRLAARLFAGVKHTFGHREPANDGARSPHQTQASPTGSPRSPEAHSPKNAEIPALVLQAEDGETQTETTKTLSHSPSGDSERGSSAKRGKSSSRSNNLSSPNTPNGGSFKKGSSLLNLDILKNLSPTPKRGLRKTTSSNALDRSIDTGAQFQLQSHKKVQQREVDEELLNFLQGETLSQIHETCQKRMNGLSTDSFVANYNPNALPNGTIQDLSTAIDNLLRTTDFADRTHEDILNQWITGTKGKILINNTALQKRVLTLKYVSERMDEISNYFQLHKINQNWQKPTTIEADRVFLLFTSLMPTLNSLLKTLDLEIQAAASTQTNAQVNTPQNAISIALPEEPKTAPQRSRSASLSKLDDMDPKAKEKLQVALASFTERQRRSPSADLELTLAQVATRANRPESSERVMPSPANHSPTTSDFAEWLGISFTEDPQLRHYKKGEVPDKYVSERQLEIILEQMNNAENPKYAEYLAIQYERCDKPMDPLLVD